MDRRNFIAAGGASALLAACGNAATTSEEVEAVAKIAKSFPKDFIWGVSTSGHQIEGQNTNADLWYLENLPNSVFAAPSGDAINHFNLWASDLDMIKSMGLNTYRFSVEWPRIEPNEGEFSRDAIEHYRNLLKGCKERGLRAIVTFNHFTAPLWFSADGGWTNAKAPKRFERYCSVIAKELGGLMDMALTFNEPQILPLVRRLGIPDFVIKKQDKTVIDAQKALGVEKFSALNVSLFSDIPRMQELLLEGHIAGREAIKSAQPRLPVGISIAIFDDQEGEDGSIIEDVREELYAPWFKLAKDDDYIGVQNYDRKIWGKSGLIKPKNDGPRNFLGGEVYSPSLAGAVRYTSSQIDKPILITEHGVGIADDTVRQTFIVEALGHLHEAISEGANVIGYCHWSLMDNFEWIFGYGPQLGLMEVDRTTFKRTPKPSAAIYGAIAKANGLN